MTDHAKQLASALRALRSNVRNITPMDRHDRYLKDDCIDMIDAALAAYDADQARKGGEEGAAV